MCSMIQINGLSDERTASWPASTGNCRLSNSTWPFEDADVRVHCNLGMWPWSWLEWLDMRHEIKSMAPPAGEFQLNLHKLQTNTAWTYRHVTVIRPNSTPPCNPHTAIVCIKSRRIDDTKNKRLYWLLDDYVVKQVRRRQSRMRQLSK